jgi:hypothetical protein
MHRPFKIASELEIKKNGACFLNPRRIGLLKLIHGNGSILSASKARGYLFFLKNNRYETRQNNGTPFGDVEASTTDAYTARDDGFLLWRRAV